MSEGTVMYVADASVAVKWFVSELESDVALMLKQQFADREINLAAPNLIGYELTQALSRSFGSHLEPIRIALAEFHEMAISLESPSLPLLKSAADLAMRYHLSAYDASYLAVASQNACPVITADREFSRRVNDPAQVQLLKEWGKSYS